MTRIAPSSFFNTMAALSRAVNAPRNASLHAPREVAAAATAVVALPTETLRTPAELLHAVRAELAPATGLGQGDANKHDLDAPVPILPEDAPMMDFGELEGAASGLTLQLQDDEAVPSSGRTGPGEAPQARVDPELSMRVTGHAQVPTPSSSETMPSVMVAPPGSSPSQDPEPAFMVAPPGADLEAPTTEGPALGAGSATLSASTTMPALSARLLGRVSSS